MHPIIPRVRVVSIYRNNALFSPHSPLQDMWGTVGKSPRWSTCTSYGSRDFDMVLGRMFTEKHFSKNAKDTVSHSHFMSDTRNNAPFLSELIFHKLWTYLAIIYINLICLCHFSRIIQLTFYIYLSNRFIYI